MSIVQVNSNGSAEEVQDPGFPGYYILNGKKVDPEGNPWKAPRKGKAEPVEEQEAIDTGTDPVTGQPK